MTHLQNTNASKDKLLQLPGGPAWFHVNISDGLATVLLTGEIGLLGQGSEQLIEQLQDSPRIKFLIRDCFGGDLRAAFALLDGLDGCEIEAEIYGRCYSAAVVVALSASKIRMADKLSKIMIHCPKIWCFGDESELSKAAENLRNYRERMARLLRAKLIPDCHELVEHWLCPGVDQYFSPVQALACGLIDTIISTPVIAKIPETADTAPTRPQTEDEIFFADLLRACGPIQVSDREKFHRNLAAWLACNVKEI